MHKEQVFTPKWIVDMMLDTIPYTGQNIRKRHIIDNSCGNGNFLVEVVRRYINQCRLENVPDDTIVRELNRYIHGIEIESKTCQECQDRLNNLVLFEMGVKSKVPLKLDIRCEDTLSVHVFDRKMDYVVGNPPYCNVHHFQYDRKNLESQYKFIQDGMTDMYLLFVEIGLRMMKPKGKLIYITPSSWINSVAGRNMREWMASTNKLAGIIDFKGETIFDGVTTFSMIMFLDGAKRKKDDTFSLVMYDKDVKDFRYQRICHLKDCIVDGKFLFCEGDMLQMIKEMQDTDRYNSGIVVKNGYATNKDELFLMDDMTDEDSPNVIPVIKASTKERMYMFYPYNENGKPLKEEEIDFPTFCHMTEKAKKIGVDPKKENWFLFGRTQALPYTWTDKVSCSSLVGKDGKPYLEYAEEGCGVFAGLMILDTMNVYHNDGIAGIIDDGFVWDGFIEYVKALAHYKSGGYFAFTSKELQKYLNYKLFLKNSLDKTK